MTQITRELPCYPLVAGKPTMYPFTGQDVGPFFIHPKYPDGDICNKRGNWTVTHTATGYLAIKGIRTKTKAISTARQLAKLGCWDFTEADQAKLIPHDILQLVNKIRWAA